MLPQVLVGEQLPTEGSIWKAQGLRLAYVAQHAFHHLEKHMQEPRCRGQVRYSHGRPPFFIGKSTETGHLLG